MRRIRPYYFLALFAFAIGLAGYAVWLREPVCEDRDLSAWLGDLTDLGREAPWTEGIARRAWDARHDKAVSAVRSMGVKALPHLLSWLRSAPGPTPLRDKLQELLDEHSPVKFKLPERHDHTDLAVEGFRALGSAAERALPELRRLLHKPAAWKGAVSSLGAIGPAAVPILASELTNSNCPRASYVVEVLEDLAPSVGPSLVPILAGGATNPNCHAHAECLTGLGNLGPLSRDLAPWLSALAQKPGDPLAGLAMRALAEVSDRPEQYLQLFSDRLNDTNMAGHAAFALARIGPDGLPPLLRALTSQEPDIKAAALAALEPKLRDRRAISGAASPDWRFSTLCKSFDSDSGGRFRTQPAAPGTQAREDFVVPNRLEAVLDHPDAAVRLAIVQLLARYGRNSAVGLSRATTDTDERVRAEARDALVKAGIEVSDGGIIRGPTNQKRIALIFAGHEYAEGGETILNELARHKAQASFFLTGDFLQSRDFGPLVQRVHREGHYLGPHLDLIYRTREQFYRDFRDNVNRAGGMGQLGRLPRYFLPSHEHYNLEIAEWAGHNLFATIGYTPGTRSTADCTGEADPGFVSSQAIFDSIVAREQQDPHGLNGFMLLLHIGSGPGRADKFPARLGELLDYLTGKGYQFVAVDELFDPQAAAERRRHIAETMEEPPPASEAASVDAFKRRYGLERR